MRCHSTVTEVCHLPNIAQGQRILVTPVGTIFGQRTMNTFLYRVSSVAGSISDTAFFDALHTVLGGSGNLLEKYSNCMSLNSWIGVAVWYQVVGPTRYRKVVKGPLTGGFDSVMTSSNVQASISRFGEFGTRASVGGVRIPIAAEHSEDGLLSAGLTAVLEELATEMKAAVAAGSPSVTLIPQVGVPGYTNDDPPVRIPVTNSIDCYEARVQDTTRVIRRRTLRVGE